MLCYQIVKYPAQTLAIEKKYQRFVRMKPIIRKIIGRRELVSFPQLALFNVEAKIDTGAYTSAIHCKEVMPFVKDGLPFVSFRVMDMQHPMIEGDTLEYPVYKTKWIKNSFGQAEERFIIKTMVGFYDESYEIELSLADRSLMDYPLLLGRKALRRRFVVDVAKVHYAPKRKTCTKQ